MKDPMKDACDALGDDMDAWARYVQQLHGMLAIAELRKEREIAAAYKRGAAWWRENGAHDDAESYLEKAAFDYADKEVSEEKRDTMSETDRMRDVIRGLLANWPHTEIMHYYMPTDVKPVLTKEEALRRAAKIVSKTA